MAHTEVNSAPRGGRSRTRHFAIGLARAFGGALIFSLPLLMTMEMWALGTQMPDQRLALFLILSIPLLIGLSYHAGFEDTFDLKEDAVDAFVALAVGFVTAVVGLAVFGILKPGMSLDEMVGKIAIQAVPGSIGALLAQSQLGVQQVDKDARGEDKDETYGGELFIMVVGSLFLALNLAPTEEMLLIAQKMTEWHALFLVLASLVIMHGFVYAVEFRGGSRRPEGVSVLSAFLRFTVVGYAIALLMSAYVLWSFGTLDGTSLQGSILTIVVLGFPAAVGAAAARLLL
jgi:putative integral membrane protein (TIGR02587 family)